MMNKLKKLLLDEKYHTPRAAQVTARGRTVPPSRSGYDSVLLIAGVVAAFAIILLFIFSDTSEGDVVIVNPETFCPLDEQYIASETYIHIDLSEKLTEPQRGWLHNLLTVAKNNKLPAHSLFSISQMQTKSTAPRVEVQRLCIPDTRNIGAAGTRVKPESCAQIIDDEFDWDTRIANNQREKITEACETYVRLEGQISAASDRYKNVNLGQDHSYIIGGIEDVMHASSPTKPTRLIVFSDMLQNAKWFSQYNTPPDKWTVKNINKLRKSETAINEMGGKPPPANRRFDKVLLCRIPSAYSILSSERNKNAHKEMWTDYFRKIMSSGLEDFQFVPASGCAVAAQGLMQDR